MDVMKPPGRGHAAAFVALLSIVGVITVFSTANFLWGLWLTDPLKSIGAFIPIISFILILRAWRSLAWEMDGTWWGLVILAVIIIVVHIRDQAILEFILSPSWSIFLPPHSFVSFAYTSGLVLLFGGRRLYRAALFPIVLMWFVNPVPNFFTIHIDLPMQHLSAGIARAFAHGLGQQLSPDQLRLMFTPEFGMFIAPGCNGIRGAVTMGFIALIAGYVYRFRVRVWAVMVVGAVLLGYVFNLVRLCVLVLYYLVALHIPWLQSRAEMGDYIIGACLFFVAAVLLFSMIRRFSPTRDLRPPSLPDPPASEVNRPAPPSFTWRAVALVIVFLFGSVNYVREIIAQKRHPHPVYDAHVLGLFPKRIGSFTLQREWNEYLVNGTLIFYWADYIADAPLANQQGHSGAGDDGPPIVSVGISPVLGAHDTLLCHAARGEDWLWHGDLDFQTAADPVHFSGSFFNSGATQYLEATTVCTGDSCGQYSSGRKHFGFIFSRPDTREVLTQSPTRPIPILLRTETLDTAMAADMARKELTDNLNEFLKNARLQDFTRPYREQ